MERTVPLSSRAFEAQLAGAPNFDLPLPHYLRLGFPTPASIQGSGLARGDRRSVHFAGGEGKPGDLVFEVAERTERSVAFRFLSDTSHIAHWLDWENAQVEWTELSRGITRVTWTLRYQRRLDPAWYFGPWERYAVGLTAEYLISTYSRTP